MGVTAADAYVYTPSQISTKTFQAPKNMSLMEGGVVGGIVLPYYNTFNKKVRHMEGVW